jgi:hopene-associated glycosyltransferase HpnB
VVITDFTMILIVAASCAAAWIYLIGGRGQFWLAGVRDRVVAPRPDHWPAVCVIVPARNEADVIGASLQSLLQQDYPGELSIIVVDDDSSDDTANAARRAAQSNRTHEVTVVTSAGPPSGWTGKLSALRQGIAVAERSSPDYLLLTDADIMHAPDTLSWLVTQSLAGQFVMTSLMAKLRCVSLAERCSVPAFVYFFQMLYPFSWVNRPHSSVAAAAGGCMLIRADALAQAGGIASIRNALIDDCSLAAKLKPIGPIWLGLTDRVRSIRRYPTFADVRQMISRSAYAQLRYSPLLLLATTAGMALVFVAPPLLTIFMTGWPRYLGLAAWFTMAISFLPILRFYRLSPVWCVTLPGIALLYLSYTLDSGYQHLRKRGGRWKGRVQADEPSVS